MGPRAATLLLLALVAPGAAAADVAREAAVAPALTVVEEAADLLREAHRAANLTGRTGAQQERAQELLEFTAPFERAASLPESATHRELAVLALGYAREVALAVAEGPRDIGIAASGGCDDETVLSRLFALERIGALRTRLHELAARAPPLVDAGALLDGPWEVPPPAECVIASPGEAGHALLLVVRPTRTWPGGHGNVSVYASNGEPIALTAPRLGLDVVLPGGRPHLVPILVPLDSPLGRVEVTATAGDLTRTERLVVDLAPTTLRVAGPRSVANGTEITLVVTLESPLPERSDEARLHVRGWIEREIQLSGGVARFTLPPPPADGPQTVTIEFAGDGVLRPASATHRISVATATAQTRAIESASLVVPLAIALGLLTAATVGAIVLLRRSRARRSVAPALDHPAESIAAAAGERAPEWDLVAAFARVRLELITLGRARRSTTARELLPLLAPFGEEGAAVVGTFERIRYGPAREPEPLGRLASWFDRALRALGVRR